MLKMKDDEMKDYEIHDKGQILCSMHKQMEYLVAAILGEGSLRPHWGTFFSHRTTMNSVWNNEKYIEKRQQNNIKDETAFNIKFAVGL